MSTFDAANLLVSAEHLVVFVLIGRYIVRLNRKIGSLSPLRVLVAFALFWGTGAVMHLAFSYQLWKLAAGVIWLRVVATPACGVAWIVVLRWIEQIFDQTAAKHRLALSEADARLADSAAFVAGLVAGAKAERDRLIGPARGKGTTTAEKLDLAAAHITRVIDQQVIDKVGTDHDAAGKKARDAGDRRLHDEGKA